MNKSPIVSVVMITYRHEPFIAEAINGVLMQEVDFPVELIIADDCSPDNTQGVVESFKGHKNYDWINYTKHKINKGMMPNFVWALEQAKGKYLALCEGDDYWTDPHKLQKQVSFLEANHDFAIAFHDAKYVNENGDEILDSIMFYNDKRDFTPNELIKINGMLPTLSMCFRNVIKKFPSQLICVANGDAVITSLIGHHGGAKFMAEILPGCYRQHSGGVWSALEDKKRYLSSSNTYFTLAKHYENDRDLKRHFLIHAKSYYKLILQRSLQKGEKGDSLLYLIKYLFDLDNEKSFKEKIMYFKATIRVLLGLKP